MANEMALRMLEYSVTFCGNGNPVCSAQRDGWLQSGRSVLVGTVPTTHTADQPDLSLYGRDGEDQITTVPLSELQAFSVNHIAPQHKTFVLLVTTKSNVPRMVYEDGCRRKLTITYTTRVMIADNGQIHSELERIAVNFVSL
nr:hypothetical protein CFP56_71237 [Quercus suber]